MQSRVGGGGRQTVMSSSLMPLLTTGHACNNLIEECGELPEAAMYSGKRALLFEGVAYNCGVACDFEQRLVGLFGGGKFLGLGIANATGAGELGVMTPVPAAQANTVQLSSIKFQWQKRRVEMALADVTIIPLGTGTPSVSKYVAGTIRALQQRKDMKYEITAMGTTIEGDLDKILAVVSEMHEEAFAQGVARVVTVIKIDDRRDKELSIGGKVESLRRELAR